MGLILMGILMAALIACVPAWPYSRRWGFGPASVCALLLLSILMLMGFGVIGPVLRAPD
jgi:hypothetical protein